MRREVFAKLDGHPAVRPFNNDIGMDASLNQHMKTYFDTTVRENRYYSEDWTFCENWRDLGGRVFVDRRVLLRHTGTYVFDYATQPKLYEDLYNLFGGQPPAPPVVTAPAPQQSIEQSAEPPAQSVLAEIFSTNREQPTPA
jgi:hypothetical protein